MMKSGRLLMLVVLTVLALWTGQPAKAEQAPAGMEPATIGYSVQGQPIQVFRLGWGPRSVVIAGAIHGSEGNTADLVNRLLANYATIQHLFPNDVSIYFVPVLNPDGLAEGVRYNANGVDLNRNWASDDWQPDSVDSSGRVPGGGGTAPFSEPETAAFSAWLLDLQSRSSGPITAVMYHAQYPPSGLVLSGSAGIPLTRAFAAIVGYAAPRSGTSGSRLGYPVTGSMPGWCHNQQMHCFEIELPNRAAVSATSLQRHATAILSVLLWQQTQPGQRCFAETGFCIAGSVRAFWERNGGLATFGLPISRLAAVADSEPSRQVQWFERARLEHDPELAPPKDVQMGRLGAEYMEHLGWEWWLFPRSGPREECLFFPETEHNICGAFLAAWQAAGLQLDGRPGNTTAESLALFGLPLSDAYTETGPDGQASTVQWFERARLEQPAGADQVEIGLLGTELHALKEN